MRSTRPPRASDLVPADDVVRGPVGALHEHVGLRALDQRERRVLGEDDDVVDGGEARQHLGALGERRIGRPAPFSRRTEASSLRPTHQDVAERARGLEIAHVPGMQRGRSTRW